MSKMAMALSCHLFLLGLVCTSALQTQEVPVSRTMACAGTRSSFNAGFGGCDVYTFGHNMHNFCDRDFDDAQGYYAYQVCGECRMCRGEIFNANNASRGVRGVAATGDPHMKNILGQSFDLMQPGAHTLVEIPRGSRDDSTLLRVAAQVSRVGVSCSDMYIMKLNVTGGWVEYAGPGMLHFEAGAHRDGDSKWFLFGQVGLKVVQGKTSDGTAYLNFFVRNLKNAGHQVGGLLGEDSHEREATPSNNCHSAISLMSFPSPEGTEQRSVAVAEEEI